VTQVFAWLRGTHWEDLPEFDGHETNGGHVLWHMLLKNVSRSKPAVWLDLEVA